MIELRSDYLDGMDWTERRAENIVTVLIRAGWATIVGGCLVILAYVTDVEVIWRPLQGCPATHPVTALLFVIGGIAVVSMQPVRTPVGALVLLLLVALTALAYLAELLPSSFGGLTSIHEIIAREAAEGTPVNLGWKTALMFNLVTLAFFMRYLGWPIASQLVAAMGMAPPLIAITGYMYGVDNFHGDMSPTTAAIGLLYSSSPLLLSARRGIMRAICSPWDAGRYGRFEIAIIGSAIFFGGYAVHSAQAHEDASTMALFVVLSILVATTTIAFATIAAEKNDRKRRHAERRISRLVQFDPLSGLYNRRFLKEQEGAILSFAERKGFGLCVVMIDIDHFKSVNDTFGHLVGDAVIRRVAKALKARLRRSDIAVRYGGEELLAVVLDTDLDSAIGIADEFRVSVASGDFLELGISGITISAGVAQVSGSLTEAIARADVALYLAKASGRNRVVGDQSFVSSARNSRKSPKTAASPAPRTKKIA